MSIFVALAVLVAEALAAEPPRIAHFVEQSGVCRWEALTPGASGPPRTLVELPGPCAVLSAQADRSGKRALLQLSTREADGGPGLYEVDLTRGTATSLGPAPVPYLSSLSYGPDGAPRLFALVSGTPVGGTPRRPASLEYEGRSFTVGDDAEGDVVIAVEYARRGGAWVLVDSALTESGFCGARNLSALAGYRATEEVADAVWADATPAEILAFQNASGRPAARDGDGAWRVQRGAWGAIAQWFDMLESLAPSNVLLVQIGGAWRPLVAQPPESSGLTVDRRGAYALVSASDLVTPPRVYDLKDGRLVWTEGSGFSTAWAP